MERKIRILLITYNPWRNDGNLGNSYSNIFKDMEDKIEFAHIYFKDVMPQNTICHKYFHISERKLLKSIMNRKPVGEAFYLLDPYNTPKESYSVAYNKARSLRWECLLMARDYLVYYGFQPRHDIWKPFLYTGSQRNHGVYQAEI